MKKFFGTTMFFIVFVLIFTGCLSKESVESIVNSELADVTDDVYKYSKILQGYPVEFTFTLRDDDSYTGNMSGSDLEDGTYSISDNTVTFTATANCKILLAPVPTDTTCPDPYTGPMSNDVITIANWRGIYGELILQKE